MKLSIKGVLVVFAVLFGVAPALHAQEYPDRPIRFILGYAAGGGPDVTARVTGQYMSQLLGQPVIVENRLGAGGVVATQAVVKAAPDGYTLLIGETGQLGIVPHLMKNLPFDTVKDLAPIALISIQPLLIASSAKSGIKSLQQMVAEARANPGKLTYGSSGIGTLHHLAMEILKADLGIDIVHVPYKGSGQSVPALLAGDVPLLVTGIPVVMPHARAGKAHLLAVTSAERSEFAPEVPAIADVAKGFNFGAEVGLLAPAGTPPAVIRKLSDTLRTAMQNPELLSKFKDSGLTPKYSTPDGYAELLRNNYRVYEKAVKAANVPSN
jgi:tripartite-type tricarboxylate transporter receptor subunit TctC